MSNKKFALIATLVFVLVPLGGTYYYTKINRERIESQTITGSVVCPNGYGRIGYKDLYGTGGADFHTDFVLFEDFRLAILDIPGVSSIIETGGQYSFGVYVANGFFDPSDVYDGIAMRLCALHAKDIEDRKNGKTVRLRR